MKDPFAYQSEASLDAFEKMFKAMSTVTRWYEAHPDAIGTERDISNVYRRTIEGLLNEAGVDQGKEMLKGAMHGVTLTVKRSA
ncbi:S-adenosyl-L-methionine-dependent methyltransferase [Penicillium angulare]|uniref:S-adenosyl-L-methionine-dependent methyltransferase n=1 Tax=Penicillium angulare TaxID=116970 RepID=UPI0025416143|nr:S-adenosyl-L-methionine-dependent methyltransferase [Penicillium angulare]KAJ5280159.1 S-adenosyl-L-methionine-dependent methyltransferase [Penicillium angulare]